MGCPVEACITEGIGDELSRPVVEIVDIVNKFRFVVELANVTFQLLLHQLEAAGCKMSVMVCRLNAKPFIGATSCQEVEEGRMNQANGALVSIGDSDNGV